MGTKEPEPEKGIGQPGEQKAPRKDTSVAVSIVHHGFLKDLAEVYKKPIQEVLGDILVLRRRQLAREPCAADLKKVATKYRAMED